MSSFEPRFSILPLEQRALWPELAPLAKLGFVLYGGTAIALRLGHRESVDFDFFASGAVDRRTLPQQVPALERAIVLDEAADSLTVAVPIGSVKVKVSLFGPLSFGRIGEPEFSADGVIVAASMTDLFSHKLKTLMQRVEVKDYRDIAAFLRAGFGLASGLSGALGIFGDQFATSDCLKALTYFGTPQLRDLPANDRKTLIEAVRHFHLRTKSLFPSPLISTKLSA